MTPEVRRALIAARAAEKTIDFARITLSVLEENHSDWAFADDVHRLLKMAQKECENSADALDPEEDDESGIVFYAHVTATQAGEKVSACADELVSAARTAGHEIKR